MNRVPSSAAIVVIGGGIIGTSTAYHLAQRGVEVVVLERGPGPQQASVRNAGGIRAQCRNRTERRLAMASIELWHKLAADTGVDFEYHRGGNLRVALHHDTLDSLAAEAVDEASDGLHTEIWDRQELRRRVPHLASRFVGAKYCPSDGHANPILATWMINDAASQAGARIVTDANVHRIEVDAGRVTAVRATIDGQSTRITTEQVVHAAGPWTPPLAADIGLDLPLVPARNAMFVTQAAAPLFSEFISSHELQVYVRQARKGHIHVGGVFAIDNTFDQTVTTPELNHLATATQIIPALRGMTVLRSWAGTLDMTPDHLPIVGTPADIAGYTIAAGFSGHGFCLGPIIGQTITELLTANTTTHNITALHPDRFTTSRSAA